MEMTSDSELLRHFAKTNSEDAFAELVKRHVNLVYSAAARQVGGDDHFAKDVAQTVFTDLARKAASLSRRENLSGWLYTSTHFAAAKMTRTETRRRDREEKFMREPTNESAPQAEWENLRPTLDDAMHKLKEADRDAILLRYFENRSFAEVGTKLGLNENAARMRVERALEKLRAVFAKRGIAATATLAAAISANAVQLAPAGLSATLTASAVTSAGAGTFTLMKILTAAKLKLGLATLVVAGGATLIALQQQGQEKLNGENAALQRKISQLQTDNQSLTNRLASVGGSKKLSDEQFNELLKLRGEVGVLLQQVGEIGQLKTENRQLSVQVSNEKNQTNQLSPRDQFELQRFHASDALKQLCLAMTMYADDNNSQYATNFDQLNHYLNGDTKINGIPISSFEFVNIGLINKKHPKMIELREITFRRTPWNQWQREYGLVDGSVLDATSDDRNFEAWEKANTYSPTSDQNQ